MVLCYGADMVDFYEVKNALREASSLENPDIGQNTQLGSLDVPVLEWLTVFHNIGVRYADLTSGGRLNTEGVRRFYELANNPEYCQTGEDSAYFENVARSPNNFVKAIELLSVEDLVKIKNHEEIN